MLAISLRHNVANKIDKLLKGLKGERRRRTKEYLEARARPLEKKTVTCRHMGEKNKGVPETVTLTAGLCPCEICGHEFMWECEDADCQCCSSVCT